MDSKDLFAKIVRKLSQIKQDKQLIINIMLCLSIIFLVNSNMNLKDYISDVEGQVYDVSEEVQSIRVEMDIRQY